MFQQLNLLIQKQFELLTKQGGLFKVEITGKNLWNIYLNSFDEHPIWRVNSMHDCNNDRHFFERYANIVAIIDNKIVSMFDSTMVISIENPISSDRAEKTRVWLTRESVIKMITTVFMYFNTKNEDVNSLIAKIFDNNEITKYHVSDSLKKF